jgi:tetratricopeptide (TPR) repeat protein
MSEATVHTIAEANAEMYDRLLVSIEAGIGLLQIFVAVCDADRQREQIIADYERELAPDIYHYCVKLDRQEPSLRHAVANIIPPKENAIVTVLGAETLGLSGQNDESLDKFFGYLQWTREALREFKIPIVLWMPSRILKELGKRSPDFWSWRNGVFQFQLEPSLVTTELLDSPVDNLNQDDRLNLVLSVEQLEASLTKAIATWGKDSRNVMTLYAQLGNLYAQRLESWTSVDREREFLLAQLYLKRAIELQKRFQQEDTLAISLNNLAELYRLMGKYTEAEPLYVSSLDLREKLLGSNHPNTAAGLNNLASLYQLIGRHIEAEPLFIRSLAINEQQLGTSHPNTTANLNNLAELYREVGRYTEAESLYIRALAINEEQLGEDHPNTAANLNNLASLYYATGRYVEAELLFIRSLAIYEQHLGVNHPNIADNLNNLAELYREMGRYTDAEPLYIRALIIDEEQLGENHPNIATGLNNLALLYYVMGRYTDAEGLFLRALEIFERSLGTNHSKTQGCRHSLELLRKNSAFPRSN